MSGFVNIIRAVFFPETQPRHEAADLVAFKEASDRMNKSVKRLAKAVEHDGLGGMVERMQRTKRQRKK